MAEPRDLAERTEHLPADRRPDRERFSGYGVMGLPFASGHVLALRRFPASSVGPGYSSVWHRDPGGRWTFYSDVEPLQSCNRYFGSAVDSFQRTEIGITWTGPRAVSVVVPGKLEWEIALEPTPVTRLMNAMGSLMPEPLWMSRRVLSVVGSVASLLLHAGKLRMYGWSPNGQDFVANPRLIWTIPKSRAVVGGGTLGPVGPVSPQAWLGGFAIPNRGLFVIGKAVFEPFDASRHTAEATRTAPHGL